jgi:hyperosmotically inducible periplasmic protein
MRNGLLIMALAVAVAAGYPARTSAQLSDAGITMKTKIALLTTQGLDVIGLNVDTVKGAITLHGKVYSDATRKKAEEVAQAVDGVESVSNLLQVVPPPEADQVAAKDAEIEAGIRSAFKANETVAKSGIALASVNKGAVLLKGKTKSLEAHLRAIELAREVKGVRRVATEVVVAGSA